MVNYSFGFETQEGAQEFFKLNPKAVMPNGPESTQVDIRSRKKYDPDQLNTLAETAGSFGGTHLGTCII